MSYRLEIENKAKRELLSLPKDAVEDLVPVLDGLQHDPRPRGSRRLTGHPGYRVRKGVYRVLYTVDDAARLVRVFRIGHRKEIYRGLP